MTLPDHVRRLLNHDLVLAYNSSGGPQAVSRSRSYLDTLEAVGLVRHEEAKERRARLVHIPSTAPISRPDLRPLAEQALEEMLSDPMAQGAGYDSQIGTSFEAALDVAEILGAISADEAENWHHRGLKVLLAPGDAAWTSQGLFLVNEDEALIDEEIASRDASLDAARFDPGRAVRVLPGPPARHAGVQLIAIEIREHGLLVASHLVMTDPDWDFCRSSSSSSPRFLVHDDRGRQHAYVCDGEGSSSTKPTPDGQITVLRTSGLYRHPPAHDAQALALTHQDHEFVVPIG